MCLVVYVSFLSSSPDPIPIFTKVLLQEGAGAPVDIIGEIKKARRDAVDASNDVDSQRRSNEVCDNGIEAKVLCAPIPTQRIIANGILLVSAV